MLPDLSSGLSGQIALITGASTGIGRATAIELARRDARVVINYPHAGERANAEETLRLVHAAVCDRVVSGDGASTAVPTLTFGNDDALGIIVEADVTEDSAVERLVQTTIDRFGRLDILVNNAGIQHQQASTHESDVALFDEVLAVNLRGPYLCARAALRHFVERGRGAIVNVSSVHERIPRPQYLSYAVSKFGLQGLTQTLALEYADRGIRVNAVGPGATATPINAAWAGDKDRTAAVASHIPMKRTAEPDEIARVIAWLASDAAPYMTGQTLFVDGGLVLYPDFQEPWSA